MQSQSLKEIADFIRTGKTPPTKETKYFNGDIQWFTPGDLDNGKFLVKSVRTLTQDAFADKKAAQFPKNTLLVACIGDIGKLGITTEECSSNQQITGIKPKNNVDVSYLYYWFRHNKLLVQNTANNAVVPILNNKTLEQIKIPLPPLAEQQKIAAILDAADSLRQKDQQLVERYTALSQSLFLEMFGDPVTNPKGWSFKNLKDLAKKISSGNTPKGGRNVYVEKGITFFRSQNVWRNKIELGDIAYIDEETHRAMKKTSLRNRDILITKTGRFNTENSSLGRAAMFCGEDDTANINGHVYLVRLKEKVNNEFVLFILTTKQYRDYIRKVCVGGIDKRQINKEHLEEFPIIDPPVELQAVFTKKLAVIEELLKKSRESFEKSESLFNSLLQIAFTGDLIAKIAA